MKVPFEHSDAVRVDHSNRSATGICEVGSINVPEPVSSAPYLAPIQSPPPWFDPDDGAFFILGPAASPVPLLFSSPHSGRRLPADMIEAARWSVEKLADRLGRLEDRFVDELFADAPGYGATLLAATVHRAYVDLNREPYELDAGMFSGAVPGHSNLRSPRVAAGLGVVARYLVDAGEIYSRKLTVAELECRLDRVHRPYHLALKEALADMRKTYGLAVLVDCHSMPSEPHGNRADVILGDRFGAACAPWLINLVQETFEGLGFSVARNAPYAGGFVTQTYGAPAKGIHAVQVELRRGTYMDETLLIKGANFDAVKSAMAQLAAVLSASVATMVGGRA